jgi:DNA-binding CsgD family transcriptional regulator/catechol-2,3-dioxygenase
MAINFRRGRPPHDDVLTPAEWRVVHAVKHGLSNREIARRRGVSLDAVKGHVSNAVMKLGLTDRNALKHWHRTPRGGALKEATMQVSDAIPSEAVRSTANPSEATPSEATPSIALGALAQIARTVRDIKQSEAWYRDVLGLPHLYTFGDLAFFDCGGTRLMLSQAPESTAAESILYWRVADIAGSHAVLKSRGVDFVNAPHMIHKHANGVEEWLAAFRDIEGRPLALIAQVSP